MRIWKKISMAYLKKLSQYVARGAAINLEKSLAGYKVTQP
jgi:hypothetical protein